MEETSSATPAKKSAVRRSNIAPWNAAVLGAKGSSIATASSIPASSTPAKVAKTSPRLARSVSNVLPPSTERQANGLTGTPRTTAPQERWEKSQGRAVGQTLHRSSSSSDLTTSSASKARPQAGAQPSVTQSSAASRPAPPIVSPVPVPHYALPQKRPRAETKESQETPLPKRQQHGRSTADNPFLSQTRTQKPALTSAEQSAAETPSIDTDNLHIMPDVSLLSSQRDTSPPRPVRRAVEMDGITIPVIEMPRYQTPNGTVLPTYGTLVPKDYKILQADVAPFICAVRDCRKRTDSFRALGGHFGAAHAATAFNDNGDGTLSQVAKYSRPNFRGCPAVVVSQTPLPADAPPPAEPSLSYANQLRMPKPSVTQSYSTDSRSPTPPSDKDGIDAVSYLHGFLSPRQSIPFREDIEYLAKLPRLRDLPDSWLQHHKSETLRQNHYAFALAYIVGEEQTIRKCTQAEKSTQKSLFRLSERCIKLPTAMPWRTMEPFSQIPTCVGCRYFSYVQKQINQCDWNPRRLIPRSVPATGEAKKQWWTELHKGNKSAGHTKPGSLPPAPEPHPHSEPLRHKAHSFVGSSSTSSHSGQATNGASEMENWEFAPGKKLDEREREAVAFSASYLTSAQPITIADDISINRLRLAPGGTQHWSAENSELRYCEVIEGKVQLKSGEQSFAVGPGGVFVIRPGMSCMAENRRYTEAVLSCHTISNYSLTPDRT